MKKLAVLATLLCSTSILHAYEEGVPCPEVALSGHYPSSQLIHVSSDSISRFVAMAFNWTSSNAFFSSPFGMEFKSYYYNYDNAAATGNGPSYVESRMFGGWFDCNLPGCYIDSSFLSDTNSVGEYKEPQVGFGVRPGFANLLKTNFTYRALTST